MQKLLILFFCVILVSGCSTTRLWFIDNEDMSIIEIPEANEPALTNAPNEPNLIIQELNPVPMDEPIQIIAPDTSVSVDNFDTQFRS